MATDPQRRVVVTGLGATSPLGGDVPTTWQAALRGTSAAHTMTHDWVAQHQLPVALELRAGGLVPG